MTGLPDAFVSLMRQQLGDEADALLRALEEERVRGLRFGGKRSRTDAKIPGVLERIPYARDGYYLEEQSPAGAMIAHEAGLYYLQEPAAMLPAAVLCPQPGERILDLCAAPGGKSTQIAAAMEGRGLLAANEIVPSRARVLSGNLERMGITNALVVSAEPAELGRRWPAFFDAVLVDAPCSGEGMFRRVPESRSEWSMSGVEGCQKRQREILAAAAGMVRPGGRLVYSTCTLNHLENEDNAAWFLEHFPEFQMQMFSLPGVGETPGHFTCYPHRFRGEGQFVACFRRAGDDVCPELPGLPEAEAKDRKLLKEFASFDSPVQHFGDTLVSLETCPELRGLKVLRCGLHLGSVRSGRFTPDHAWAVSVKRPELPEIQLTDEQALQYLAGEVIRDVEGRGWVLACWKGLCLGFGKISDGIMKNHYPKGLRKTHLSLGEDCGENL